MSVRCVSAYSRPAEEEPPIEGIQELFIQGSFSKKPTYCCHPCVYSSIQKATPTLLHIDRNIKILILETPLTNQILKYFVYCDITIPPNVCCKVAQRVCDVVSVYTYQTYQKKYRSIFFTLDQEKEMADGCLGTSQKPIQDMQEISEYTSRGNWCFSEEDSFSCQWKTLTRQHDQSTSFVLPDGTLVKQEQADGWSAFDEKLCDQIKQALQTGDIPRKSVPKIYMFLPPCSKSSPPEGYEARDGLIKDNIGPPEASQLQNLHKTSKAGEITQILEVEDGSTKKKDFVLLGSYRYHRGDNKTTERQIEFKLDEHDSIIAIVNAKTSEGSPKEISRLCDRDIVVEKVIDRHKREYLPFSSLVIKTQKELISKLSPTGSWKIEVSSDIGADPYFEKIIRLKFFNTKAPETEVKTAVDLVLKSASVCQEATVVENKEKKGPPLVLGSYKYRYGPSKSYNRQIEFKQHKNISIEATVSAITPQNDSKEIGHLSNKNIVIEEVIDALRRKYVPFSQLSVEKQKNLIKGLISSDEWQIEISSDIGDTPYFEKIIRLKFFKSVRKNEPRT